MKTHHFILKEDGNIYVIPEIGNAKESALLVKNQDEVKKSIYDADPGRNTGVDTYFRLGEIYPLECGIEVKKFSCNSRLSSNELPCPKSAIEFPDCCGDNKKVALITFSEPSKEVVEEPTQDELWEIVKHAYWALAEIHCEPTMGGANLSFRNRKLLIEMSGEFHERLNAYCAKHPNHDLTNRKPPITNKAP